MSRPLTLDGPVGDLIRAYGSLKEFAKAVPCAESTVIRWVRGVDGKIFSPTPLVAKRVNEMARAKRLPMPFKEESA